MYKWAQAGITVGNVNLGGYSDFKIFLLMEYMQVDVLCMQETWLSPEASTIYIPGYTCYEQRRNNSKRGGIAILVKKGLKVENVVGNEYA